MSLTVKESVGNFKNVDPGTYPARCVRLIDIGSQHSEYQGKPIVKQQIIISWELPTELIADDEFAGQPYMVSKFYTASLGEKANLRKDLETWRGKAFTEPELQGFDLKKILGAPCMVSVIHNENGKTKVNGVMAVPKGMTVPPQVNQPLVFDVNEWNQAIFENLSEGIQKLIMQSDEYKFPNQAVGQGGEPNMPSEGEIPF